jgi:hypothetical protein
MIKPLIQKKFILEKIAGKGGWTYVRLPKLKFKSKAPFGMVKVKGTIDGFEICQYNLMPMGNGGLFLPVRAEIRKKIRKECGDIVMVILYPDNDIFETPGEFMLCLQDEPLALKFFTSLSEGQKRVYVQWIYSAKKEETKVNRMAASINRLAKGLRSYDPEVKME